MPIRSSFAKHCIKKPVKSRGTPPAYPCKHVGWGEARTPTGEARTPTGEARTPTGEARTPTGEARTPTGEAATPDR